MTFGLKIWLVFVIILWWTSIFVDHILMDALKMATAIGGTLLVTMLLTQHHGK